MVDKSYGEDRNSPWIMREVESPVKGRSDFELTPNPNYVPSRAERESSEKLVNYIDAIQRWRARSARGTRDMFFRSVA